MSEHAAGRGVTLNQRAMQKYTDKHLHTTVNRYAKP